MILQKWLAGLLIGLFTVAAMADSNAPDDGPERIATFAVRQLQKFPEAKQRKFSAVIDVSSRLVRFGQGELLSEIIKRYRRVSAYDQTRFSMSSDIHSYDQPANFYAALIGELTRKNFAVACEFNAGPALGAEASIAKLKSNLSQTTWLSCVFL